MTQPGGSAWAAVPVTLFWGKHCWQDIQWNRDIFQLHQLDLQSHSAPDLVAAEHGGVQRAASGSRTAGLHNARRNCFAPLAALTGMFPSVTGLLV